VIFHEWSPCRQPTDPVDAGLRRRYRRSDGSILAEATANLWPFSDITAGVVVLNGAKEGDISNTVTFSTPQGGERSFLMLQRVLIIFFFTTNGSITTIKIRCFMMCEILQHVQESCRQYVINPLTPTVVIWVQL